jgi:hypothetical protein
VSDSVIPPTPGIWTSCAAENGTCSFSNTQTVAYGASGQYKMGQYTTSVACNNTTFTDPIPGTVKSCYNAVLPANPSFEAPVTTDYVYNPSAASWTFTGGAGTGSGVQKTGNNGSWGAAFAPQGAQTGFVQNSGSVTQTLTNIPAATYSVTFLAAKRQGYAGTQSLNVLIDGVSRGTFTPASTAFTPFTTSTVALATGNHTIAIVGTNTSGDNTDFIDSVSLLKN